MVPSADPGGTGAGERRRYRRDRSQRRHVGYRPVDADDRLDLVDGAAGCLVALLALHELRPAAATLAAAVRCGERLLARAEPQPAGIGWRNVPVFPLPLTGFSHGAAGIAWSLLRLAAATGEERFAAAACQGLAFERSLYSPERGNWLDRRGEMARAETASGSAHDPRQAAETGAPRPRPGRRVLKAHRGRPWLCCSSRECKRRARSRPHSAGGPSTAASPRWDGLEPVKSARAAVGDQTLRERKDPRSGPAGLLKRYAARRFIRTSAQCS